MAVRRYALGPPFAGCMLHCTAPSAAIRLLACGSNRGDAMSQDQVERRWFVRCVTVLMSAALLFGAVPVLKNTLFPVQKNRPQ
jgi:hypothetical protein